MTVYRCATINYFVLLVGILSLTLNVEVEAQAGKPRGIPIAPGRQATITLMEGNVYRLDETLNRIAPLRLTEPPRAGDIIGTGKKSRLVLKLPDNSQLRFDENTTFKLVAMRYHAPTKLRNINIRIIVGKTWAKVAKIFKGKGRFELTTHTAVAGVRGTIYRLNAYADHSATIKVYEGEVAVNSKPAMFGVKAPHALSAPAEVAGPHVIAGPHPVSMTEWVHILKAMQQINIQKDGTATQPFAFDLKEDLNDWVSWNLALDKQ